MNIFDVFDCYCLLIRRYPERDELGDDIPKIDVNIMTAKPLLVDSVDKFRTLS